MEEIPLAGMIFRFLLFVLFVFYLFFLGQTIPSGKVEAEKVKIKEE